jgi:hypothetical protein
MMHIIRYQWDEDAVCTDGRLRCPYVRAWLRCTTERPLLLYPFVPFRSPLSTGWDMGLSFLFNLSDNGPRCTNEPWRLLPFGLTEFEFHPADEAQAHQDSLIAGFMFLQIFGGHFGIPLILLTTAFSKKVQRHPMLINFCVTWSLYATSFTLL